MREEKREKWFRIHCVVDNGEDHIDDFALVRACDPEHAHDKLNRYIRSLGYEMSVETVFSITEYSGDVFTRKHGCRERGK